MKKSHLIASLCACFILAFQPANAAIVQQKLTGSFSTSLNPDLVGEAFEFSFSWESTTPCRGDCTAPIWDGALKSASLTVIGETIEWQADQLSDSSIILALGGGGRGNTVAISAASSTFGNDFQFVIENFDLTVSKWPGTPGTVFDGLNLPDSFSAPQADPLNGEVRSFTLLAGSDIWASTRGSLTLSVVPIPPAVWLFGSGLLGLIGVARRKARS